MSLVYIKRNKYVIMHKTLIVVMTNGHPLLLPAVSMPSLSYLIKLNMTMSMGASTHSNPDNKMFVFNHPANRFPCFLTSYVSVGSKRKNSFNQIKNGALFHLLNLTTVKALLYFTKQVY